MIYILIGCEAFKEPGSKTLVYSSAFIIGRTLKLRKLMEEEQR